MRPNAIRRHVGCAIAAACVVWSAALAPAAVPCGGDCNGDGRVAVDELIAGIAAALGGELEDCGADVDDDRRVAIGELIRLVGLALAGCPRPLDLAVLDGVYDADARGQTDPSGGFNERGVAAVDVSGDAVDIVIHFGPLRTVTLSGGASGDGVLALSGEAVQGGEHHFIVQAELAVTQQQGDVVMQGTMDLELTGLPVFYTLDVMLERPLAGAPAELGGVQRFAVRHPMPSGGTRVSRIDLPLTVPRSGRAACAAAADTLPDGSIRAELPAADCLVSSSGRFHYAAPYLTADGAPPLTLYLSGTLRGDDGVGRGNFYLAEFPLVAESGVWDVAPAP